MKRFILLLVSLLLLLSVAGCNNSSTDAKKDPTVGSTESASGSAQPAPTSTAPTAPESAGKTDLRVDPSKDWVYTLENERLAALTEYKDAVGRTQDPKTNIQVPQLNIDSPDAKQFNEEMQSYAEFLALTHEHGQKQDEAYWYIESSYKSYLNGNLLSVLIISDRSGTAPTYSYYNTINIDTTTGKIVTFKEAADLFQLGDLFPYLLGHALKDRQVFFEAKFPEHELNYLTGHTLRYLYSILYEHENPEYEADHASYKPDYIPEEYSEEADRRFWPTSDLSDPVADLKWYLDEDGEFCIVYLNFIPAGSGRVFVTRRLLDVEPGEQNINGLYYFMAQYLGIKPEEGPLVLSAFLGYASEENQLAAIARKLNTVLSSYSLDEIAMYSRYRYSMNNFGDEFYLLVPKYDTVTLTVCTAKSSEADPLPKNPEYQAHYTTTGVLLFNANPSDIRGDTEIRIQSPNHYETYHPGVNLSDGGNSIDSDEVLDITSIIPETESDNPELMERLLELIPRMVGQNQIPVLR